MTIIFGFFATLGFVIYIDAFMFGISLSESQIINIMIGSLLGSVGTIIAFLYKEKLEEMKKK